MISAPKINNYWNGDYVTSSTDMMAVKAGIKKITRIECVSVHDFKDIKKSLDKHGLKYIFSDTRVFEKYNVYIALSEKMAKKARDVDPTYKIFIDKLNFNDCLPYIKQFSELLSYPKCCVESYLDNIINHRQIQDIKTIKKLPDKINFYLNNSLNGFSNYYLSFHLPCSFLCKHNEKYQKNIFSAIKMENPEFATKLEKTLKNPFLLFFQKNQGSAYAAWDKRQGVIFDGSVENNRIKYSQLFFLETAYPDYVNEKVDKNEIADIVSAVKKGDSLRLENQTLFIRKQKKLVKKISSDNYVFYIFNFV